MSATRPRRWARRLGIAVAACGAIGAVAAGGAYAVAPLKVRMLVGKARSAYVRGRWALHLKLHPPAPFGKGVRPPQELKIAETIYAGGLQKPWEDYGWATREIAPPGPARVDLSAWNGWILHRGSGSFAADRSGGLLVTVRVPAGYPEYLEVVLMADGQSNFPTVNVVPRHRRDLEGGLVEVVVPMRELNPFGLDFELIRIRSAAATAKGPFTIFETIALLAPDASPEPVAKLPSREAKMTISCDGATYPINPLIYGMSSQDIPEDMGITAYRWGGNVFSRYNWKIPAAATANDWYFQNITGLSYLDYLATAAKRNAKVALTVPMLGWVAKDTSSASFPVSVFGPQKGTDPQHPDYGNGVGMDDKPIPPGPPTRTSIEWPPERVAEWVRAIRAEDAKRGTRSVHQYILDNEPALWSSTHRDVHPEPLTYDELLDKTIRYGTAVRTADPEAVIAGPAEWGWPNYFFSAADAVAGFDKKPDRLAHGDVPLLAWYLRKLREHEQRTGVHILDILDVHFYPQADGVYWTQNPGDTAPLRFRQTRGLWDPTYRDESWINEPVRLIPRLKELIAENFPGRGISIGEWNFGAEGHLSGGLAVAEALGRFAEGGVTSAFFWGAPKKGASSYWGFRAYRNYDGDGGHFLDTYVPARASSEMSIFASRTGDRLVAIVLNFDNAKSADVKIDLASCGRVAARRTFSYWGRAAGFIRSPNEPVGTTTVEETVMPYSITVFEVDLKKG